MHHVVQFEVAFQALATATTMMTTRTVAQEPKTDAFLAKRRLRKNDERYIQNHDLPQQEVTDIAQHGQIITVDPGQGTPIYAVNITATTMVEMQPEFMLGKGRIHHVPEAVRGGGQPVLKKRKSVPGRQRANRKAAFTYRRRTRDSDTKERLFK